VCLFSGFAGRLFFLVRDAETTAKDIFGCLGYQTWPVEARRPFAGPVAGIPALQPSGPAAPA
jgi:hypothetical protein